MSNVKPGDMAKFREGHSHAGQLCAVIAPADESERAECRQYAAGWSEDIVLWQIQLLSGHSLKVWRVKADGSDTEQVVPGPGGHFVAWDRWLQRIDPPAEETTTETTQEIHS